MSHFRYQVFFTPKVNATTYGDEVNVSDRVIARTVKSITRSIDSEDFGIGVYTHDDITLTGFNQDGFFNSQDDSRSMFAFTRDLTKVRIVYYKYTNAENDGENRTEETTITFRGFINEEATKLDVESDQINFRVLSRDSVIRKTKVTPGAVPNGQSFKNAIVSVLGNTDIRAVLTVDSTNINPKYNGTVDDGSSFDNVVTKDALNDLLAASNSYLFIDETDTVIVKSRDVAPDKSKPLRLYGKSARGNKENIVGIKNFNTGTHRIFNSVRIGNFQSDNLPSIQEYGTRQRVFSLNFVTTQVASQAISAALVDEFKYPKMEMEVIVATETARDHDLLDRVSVDYPLRVEPTGPFLPVVGATKVGDSNFPVPAIFGSLQISPDIGWKIIEIREDPGTFLSTLKIRQRGSELSDGNDENAPDQTIHCEYDTDIDASWADGNGTGSGTNSPTVVSERLDLTGVGVPTFVDYTGLLNASPAVQRFCIRFLCTPGYSGSPGADRPFCAMGNNGNDKNKVELTHLTGGGIEILVYDRFGTAIVNYTTPAFVAVSGTEVEIELNCDVDLGQTRLFVAGSQLGVTQTGTGNRSNGTGFFRVGARANATGIPDAQFRRVRLFKNVQHTEDYTPEVL